MDEDLPVPGSPPLPKKGSYAIDFDNLDEFSNPFESKNKVMMGSSPIQSNNSYALAEDIDPFKSKKSLANSPPDSPRAPKTFDRFEAEPVEENETQPPPEPLETSLLNNTPTENEKVNQKKKKIVKKPVQSKFKPPKSFKKQKNTDDIEIVMPPGMEVDSTGVDNKLEDSTVNNIEPQEKVLDTPNDMPIPEPSEIPNNLASKLDAENNFEEDNMKPAGCSVSNEEFKDAVDWSLQNNQNSPHASKELAVSGEKDRSEAEKISLPNANAANLPSVRKSEPIITEKHPALRALETTQGGNSPLIVKMSGGTLEKKDAAGGDKKDTVVQVVQVLRYSQTDWNKLKQELELNFQTNLLNKEQDWSRLLADRDKKIRSLEESNKKLKATRDDMRAVVTDFEKTMAQLQGDKEKMRSESQTRVKDLEDERNQALEDLSSVENAFSDLHRRYEKSKTVIEGFKRNEDELKECMEDLRQKLKKSESKLGALKSQAEEKLDKANEDIDKIKKSTKSDVARLEAALKKSELRISSLEEALSRKEKENHELTAICDELIAKVGS